MPPNENNASAQSVPILLHPLKHLRNADKHGYYRLGRTTFYYMFLKYCLPALFLSLIELALLATAGGENILPPFSEWFSSSPVFAEAIRIAIVTIPPLIFVAAGLALVMAYAWYYSFRYKIGDNDISFEKGLIGRQEISIPFRQIQNADVEQSILYRIFNLADLVILTAGHEDPERATENESEIVMPALNADEARRLHEYLLDRANVQKIVSVIASTEPGIPEPLH